MECPRCKLISPMGAKRCDCGFDFETGTITGPDTRNQQVEPPKFTQTPTITQDSGSGDGSTGGGVPGWVWFVLIYGVGNLILYPTTGILLIPIPRK